MVKITLFAGNLYFGVLSRVYYAKDSPFHHYFNGCFKHSPDSFRRQSILGSDRAELLPVELDESDVERHERDEWDDGKRW